MAAARAVVVGEALVDVIRRPDGTEARHPGGSPANVALGLARLGRSTTLLTQLGADDDGVLVRRHLSVAGVGLQVAAVERTSTAVAELDGGGAARYTFDLAWSLGQEPLPADAVVVHAGSLATTVEPGATAVARMLATARTTSTVSYDPNIRPMLMGPADETRVQVEALVEISDVVKASDEDLKWLAPGEPIAAVAQRWLERGPALVVVTRGAGGALAVTSNGLVEVSTPPAEVVDTVGAGDSVTAALLDGLWAEGLLGAAQRTTLRTADRELVQRVLERAVRAAAITVGRTGADLPTRTELPSSPMRSK